MGSCVTSAAAPSVTSASVSLTGYDVPESSSDIPDIPDNAIYANGEAIPDQSGGGYLTYEV